MNTQSKKRVPITKLAVGDFVEAVTKQLGDVNVVQTGIVRNHFALQALKKKGVIEVLVDPSRSKLNTTPNKINTAHKTHLSRLIDAAMVWQTRADDLMQISLDRAQASLPIDLLNIELLAKDAFKLTEKHIDSLGLIVRSKMSDNSLTSHLIRIAIALAQFSVQNNYSSQSSCNLIFAGLLSRIGFHLLPASLQHADDKLSPLEKVKKQKHGEKLLTLLALSGQPNDQVIKLLQEQDELLDGTGSPNQLNHNNLNSAQKVLAIAINYDSYVFGFNQMKAMGSTAAFRLMMERSPAHFDPDLLQAFIQAVGLYPAGTLVKLQSGRIALVIENQEQLTKPRLKVFYNGEFNHHIATKLIDLTDSDDVIEGTVKAQRYGLAIDELVTADNI